MHPVTISGLSQHLFSTGTESLSFGKIINIFGSKLGILGVFPNWEGSVYQTQLKRLTALKIYMYICQSVLALDQFTQSTFFASALEHHFFMRNFTCWYSDVTICTDKKWYLVRIGILPVHYFPSKIIKENYIYLSLIALTKLWSRC